MYLLGEVKVGMGESIIGAKGVTHITTFSEAVEHFCGDGRKDFHDRDIIGLMDFRVFFDQREKKFSELYEQMAVFGGEELEDEEDDDKDSDADFVPVGDGKARNGGGKKRKRGKISRKKEGKMKARLVDARRRILHSLKEIGELSSSIDSDMRDFIRYRTLTRGGELEGHLSGMELLDDPQKNYNSIVCGIDSIQKLSNVKNAFKALDGDPVQTSLYCQETLQGKNEATTGFVAIGKAFIEAYFTKKNKQNVPQKMIKNA
eukprot:2949691-Rhodomonas_salina.1